MWCRLAGTLVAFLLLAGSGADAQTADVPCDAFQKNDDGSWSALRSAQITGTGDRLTIRDGSVLRPGATIRGQDLAALLDQKCPAVPASAEPAASVQPAQPGQPGQPTAAQPARVALATYGDLYGNIDPQRLSCGQLTDASAQETELFLAWYSGWLNGTAKKRAVNLAKMGGGIRSVLDYCRANRDKKLIQVMDLMLK